jgi:PAS domain S-box-containing protein
VSIVSVLVAGLYRLALGGNGVWAGTATILSCAMVGLVFRRITGNRPSRLGLPALYAVGIGAHVVMLACQLLVIPWPAGLAAIGRLWMPILLIFPVATVLMGVLLRTEDRRVETVEALRESEDKFKHFFENSNVGQSITQVSGEISVNQAFCEMLGYSRQELQARKWQEITHPEDIELSQREIDCLLSGENNETRFIKRYLRKDGQIYWADISISLRRDAAGKPLYFMTALVDITERKHAEAEIRQLNATLEQRVETRTHDLQLAQEQLVRQEKLAVLGQLAGGVGHELRNPLGVISNSIYYLKLVQPDANKKVRQHHIMIENEVHNATRIVGDLLDYARLSSAERKPLSVAGLVSQTLDRFHVQPGVKLSLDLPEDLPQVCADALHIQQVLGNLITNACQAMPEGGRLAISAGRENDQVWIAVEDSGIGIPPENMPKLFEPLYTTKATGIGLGLAVSKKLVEANGGRFEVHSESGQGSTFTLYLPAEFGQVVPPQGVE